jgi:hypothetical protein
LSAFLAVTTRIRGQPFLTAWMKRAAASCAWGRVSDGISRHSRPSQRVLARAKSGSSTMSSRRGERVFEVHAPELKRCALARQLAVARPQV